MAAHKTFFATVFVTGVRALAILAPALVTAQAPAGNPAEPRPCITLDGARQALAAAVAEARARKVGGAFAVVDAGGHLVAMDRLDGTFAAAAHVSIDKARTAAMFQKPTRVFEDAIRNGRTSMVALSDFTPLQGGVPIVLEGRVIGAIGVSGASSAAEDDELAILGAGAVAGSPGMTRLSSASPAETVQLDSAMVKRAFARGAPLLENASFKIHASRRDRPGEAEVHADETDIIYVLEGAAVMVTGGTVVNGVETAPHEIRGPSIDGGQTRNLQAGDVLVVPAGTPHWFRSVDGPVLYYVVKVVEKT